MFAIFLLLAIFAGNPFLLVTLHRCWPLYMQLPTPIIAHRSASTPALLAITEDRLKMFTVLLVIVLTAGMIDAFTAVPPEPKEPKPIITQPHCTDPISCRYCTCLPNDPCDKKAG